MCGKRRDVDRWQVISTARWHEIGLGMSRMWPEALGEGVGGYFECRMDEDKQGTEREVGSKVGRFWNVLNAVQANNLTKWISKWLILSHTWIDWRARTKFSLPTSGLTMVDRRRSQLLKRVGRHVTVPE